MMRIFIEKATVINSKTKVCFSSVFGSSQAYWEGIMPPNTPGEYDVEIEVKEILTWDKDIVESEIKDSFVDFCDEHNIFGGKIVSIDDDGYTVIRLDNSIITFMTKGDKFKIGAYIKVQTELVSLFPIDY